MNLPPGFHPTDPDAPVIHLVKTVLHGGRSLADNVERLRARRMGKTRKGGVGEGLEVPGQELEQKSENEQEQAL